MKAGDIRVYGAVLVVFVAGVFIGTALNGQRGGMEITGAMISQLPGMSTDGYLETDVSVGTSDIYLSDPPCHRLTITTNELQTYSINSGLKGIRGPRPTAHDIMHDTLDTFGVECIAVKIESLEQGTYFAKLAMRQGTKVLNMDIRPSDAIAIAIRSGAPVYVNQTLMEKYGEYVC